MSTPDPALIDTDVASVLYRGGLFQRVVPGRLVGIVNERPLAISVRDHTPQAPLGVGADVDAERGDHPPGDLLLDPEQVVEGAVEAFGPELEPRPRVDELHRDAQVLAEAAHASLEHDRDRQLLPDATDVDPRLAEPERRGAGGDP